jgi:hypothetical protein
MYSLLLDFANNISFEPRPAHLFKVLSVADSGYINTGEWLSRDYSPHGFSMYLVPVI